MTGDSDSIPPPSCAAEPRASTSFFHYISFACVRDVIATRNGLAIVLCLVAILVVRYIMNPWRFVPPGPRGLPIIGNVLQLQDRTWLFERNCKQKFNDMMYLNALGQPVLILNSLKSATELLVRRANIYSDRPRLIMAHEIFCGGLFTAFIPYGDFWRRSRRAAHEGLSKSAVRSYHMILRKEGVLLASALLENPGALEKLFQRTAASAIMSIVYDYPTLEIENDKNVKDIRVFNERMSKAGAPGAYLVELFPWMVYIPEIFAKWKYEGKRYFIQHTSMFESLFNDIHLEISKGSERPSICASLITDSDRNGLSNREMAWLAGTLFSAGADTTSTTMYWWALAMIAHPGVQKRAQAELDAVVGQSRVPTFSDAPSLPHIQAMVKEILRWRPVLPLALPHIATDDDWYEGMFIPKGTICLANLWQCHLDPQYYGEDAASFNPERFLDAHGKIIPGPADTREEGHLAYGLGRRACVGKHAANESLFIYIATILWAANLETVRDEDGKEVPLDTNTFVDTGAVFKPAPYECRITPRLPEALSILAEEKEMFDVRATDRRCE